MAVSLRETGRVRGNTCRTLIVGLGESGLSVARYLSRTGAQVAIVDNRMEPPGLARLREELSDDIALFLGRFHHEAFTRAERIVVSPGVSVNEPEIAAAAARGVEIIGDIELFVRAATAPVVAVTGSNGKSTVTTLFGVMAKQAGLEVRVGGNLGTPALDLLGKAEPDCYALELSSFQLETTHNLRAAAATVLNISADHLDRYPDLAAYAASKQRIYQGARVQVVNRDDANAADLADPQRQQIGFTLAPPAEGDYGIIMHGDEQWLARGNKALMPVSGLRMAGWHNTGNALAALALGGAIGLPQDIMIETLREFPGLPHRCQWIGEYNGVSWYNDSKGTNVGATQAAIRGTAGPVVLIAGGDGKGADFSPLADSVRDKCRAVILIGQDAPRLEEAIGGAAPVVHAASMREAVLCASERMLPGDSVLLSPACSSLDMFRDYQERGTAFMDSVRELMK